MGWYASDSLRHRREHGDEGYLLEGGELDVRSDAFLHACESLTSAPIAYGNELDLLINGDQIFPAMVEAIHGARTTVNLLTYVYWRGDVAVEVAEALRDAARRGVEVNVLLDALGTAKMERRLIREMQEAGVEVRRFRPPKPYALRRLTNRTHRKLLIVDGAVGFTGGVGIADEWSGDAQDPDHWRDTHVRVRGPVVRGLQGAFAENWLEATGKVLVGDGHLPDLEPIDGGAAMQVVRSSAGVGDTEVEALYFLAIACARETLDLTNAYFVPRPAFIDALADAAKRGVRVRILVPGRHIDKGFVRLAGHATYGELTDAGCEVWEFCPTMLHAKTLTIDGCWSSVGSVNFDNRSFQLHDEATLCVRSADVARRLTEVFEVDLERSERIDAERWSDRPLRAKALEHGLKLARREL